MKRSKIQYYSLDVDNDAAEPCISPPLSLEERTDSSDKHLKMFKPVPRLKRQKLTAWNLMLISDIFWLSCLS